MARRKGKFYFRNERETLEYLGLKQVPGSGNGWIAKEDGENELALVQLKSTDSNSYTIKQLDIQQLEYHADVSHKVPIFLIQFLKQNRVYALLDVENIPEVYKALNFGEKPQKVLIEQVEPRGREKVKGSKNAREKFHEERRLKYGKGK